MREHVSVDYRELFRSFRQRPGMYLGRAELGYPSAVAFVAGVDHGSEFAVLDAFREYLVLQLGHGNNLGWESLVLQLRLPADFSRPLSAENDQLAVAGLFDLLDEFLTEMGRHSSSSRAAVHREYLLWLQAQSWYDVDLQRFGSSPPGDLVDVGEAAAILGIELKALLDRVYEGEIRGGRVGPRLLFRRAVIESNLDQA